MRILAIVKDGEKKHQLRRLIDKGHQVTMVNNIDNVPYRDIDVVVSLSEKSVEDAFAVSQRYNIPFYAHMDWIPPWMVFRDSEYNWGHIERIPYAKKMNFIRKYQNLAMYWSMADVKSLSADCFHKLMREIIGISDLNIYTKHPRPNDLEIVEHKAKWESPQRPEITCVSRFLPHKRIHHIIKALQIIDFDGVLNLVGSGEDKTLYDAIKGDLSINYVSELDKYNTIAGSQVVIALWNATVALEALSFNVPVIAYESEYMREICGDTVKYVTNNSISELARKIKEVYHKEPEEIVYINPEDDILEQLIMKAVRK